MTGRKWVIVAIVVALLLTLIGCGGGGEETGTSSGEGDGSTLTPASGWIERLTAQPLPTSPPFPTVIPLTRTAEPSASSPPVATEYGIQIHGCGYPPDPALDMVRDAGFTWVKQQVRWDEIEGGRYGEMSWDCIDQVVDGANERGLKVLLSVVTTPWWALADEEARHPENPTIFAHFCMAIAERYGNRIHAIEIWNEPNLAMEWGAGIDAADYAAMLELTVSALEQANPDLLVISAALAPTEWNQWDVALPDTQFLNDLVDLGALDLVDCVGAHFNHGTSSPLIPGGQFDQLILGYREITNNELPICITELGYAVPRGGVPDAFEWAADNTAEDQAQWLVDSYEWIDQHPGIVQLVIVWNLNYWFPSSDDPNAMYAIWSPRGMMPAYDALREANSQRLP